MTTDATRLERMLKLLALAKDGVGGERENADALLNEMLKRHGLTREDLERQGEPVRFYDCRPPDSKTPPPRRGGGAERPIMRYMGFCNA